MRDPRERKDVRSLRGWLIRVGLSVAVLGILFWLLPMEGVWGAMKSVPAGLWILVLGIFFLGHGVAAIKWWLLTIRDDDIPLGTALKAHFAGLAANLCLPGVGGGDILRAALVFRTSENKTHVAVGSLTDRLLDVFGLLILSGAGALLSVDTGGSAVGLLQKIGVFLVVIVAMVIPGAFLISRLPLRGSLKTLGDKVTTVIMDFARQPGRLGFCLVLSIAVQAMFIQLNIALAGAAGVQVPAAAWFFAWPLAKLIAAAPISLAGLGIREASLAALLTPLGGKATQIVAVGLLWQTILLSAGALSGIAIALGPRLNHSVAGRPPPKIVHDEPDGERNTGENYLG